MKHLGILLASLALLAACAEPDAGIGTSTGTNTPASAPSIPAGALTYKTRTGTFRVHLPEQYVSVKHTDNAFLSVFQKQMPGLEIVDVFLTTSDLARSSTPDQLMVDQLVQLQLFPAEAPEVTDEGWEELRSQLPATMSGRAAKVRILEGIERVNAQQNPPAGALRIADMAVGTVVVYSNTAESVRWATTGELAVEGSASPQRLVIASAARRVGKQIYLVQSSKVVASDQEALEAVAMLDSWLARIWALPE